MCANASTTRTIEAQVTVYGQISVTIIARVCRAKRAFCEEILCFRIWFVFFAVVVCARVGMLWELFWDCF